jgi:hypothetical protein
LNINEAIRSLYEERKQIDRLIARLEQRKTLSSGTPQRPRKMTADKRIEVSRRMKAYWAARRRPTDKGSAPGATPASGELRP